MAATVSVKEVNGAAAGTPTTITNLRFKTKDETTQDNNYTLLKPDAGVNYSFKKTVFLNADDSPAGTINNIKFFCDGDIGWTGVSVKALPADAYTQATGTESTSGDELETAVDIETYTSASPLALTGSIDNPDTGKISQYLQMQALVSTGAGPGGLSPETCTFRYDET